MARSQADLLAMKDYLTNDPDGLGLTTLPADDAANADKVNAIDPQFQIDREAIPTQEIFLQIDRDEYAALSQADRDWLNGVTASGSVNPSGVSEVKEGLLQLFGAGTESRTNLQAILTVDGSAWQKLVQDGTLVQEGDWTPSEIAAARQAT